MPQQFIGDDRHLDPYDGLPTSVRIGNMEWKIEVASQQDSQANGEFGHCNTLSQRIRLAPNQTAQCLANSLLHEILHAIHWVYGLWRNDPDEEHYTNQTANGLCAFFQDNPYAMQWIMKKNELSNR